MKSESTRTRSWRNLLQLRSAHWVGLVLLAVVCVSCAGIDRYRVVCIDQDYDTLEEVASGKLDRFNPNVAAWERQVAALCGWTTQEDINARID